MPPLKKTLRLVVGLRAAPLLLGYAAVPAAREVIGLDVIRWLEV